MGATYRLVAPFLRWRIEAEYEVTQHEPNWMAAWKTVKGPLPLTFWRKVEPADGGTRVTIGYNAELRGMASCFCRSPKPWASEPSPGTSPRSRNSWKPAPSERRHRRSQIAHPRASADANGAIRAWQGCNSTRAATSRRCAGSPAREGGRGLRSAEHLDQGQSAEGPVRGTSRRGPRPGSRVKIVLCQGRLFVSPRISSTCCNGSATDVSGACTSRATSTAFGHGPSNVAVL